MISGGKNNYQCLFSLISNTVPRLAELIETLCLEGTFRSQKYAYTFLLPNDKLISHLEKLSEADKNKEAIHGIRSLVLKGHIKKSDFKDGAVIGTVQFGKYTLADPAAIKKDIEESSKHVVDDMRGTIVSLVYNYSGELPPKTKEGEATEQVPVSAVSGGNAHMDEDCKIVDEFTKKLIVRGDAKATLCNFFKAVSSALAYLKEHDAHRFNNAKFYLAANPVVAWFFLTMQGCQHALLKPSEVKDLTLHTISAEIIQEAERADGYEFSNALMQEIASIRKKIMEEGDAAHIPNSIIAAYERMLPKMIQQKAASSDISKDLKIRMDELRAMHESDVDTFEDISDAIDELSIAENYTHPKKRHSFCDEAFLSKFVGCKELIMSGPCAFIRSAYLIYVPLTSAIESKLVNLLKTRCGGAINGGNPASINTVVFAGGAARRALLKLHKPTNLKAMVSLLSSREREELKSML